MKSFICAIFALCLCAPCALGQEARRSEQHQYVIAPAENILVAIAAQPECPLKIEGAQLLISTDGGQPIYRYTLVNRGSKSIRYFTVVAWSSQGTGGTLGGPPPWDGRVQSRLLQSGESVDVGQNRVDEVALTPALRERLNLNAGLQMLTVLLVDQITFGDGSKYDALKTSKSLIDYFSQLENNIPRI